MNIIIYDCEIKRGIPARGEEKIPGIEYCKGWGDHRGMGVSVTGVHEHATGRTRVFCDDNVDEMLELMARADLLVGFNNIGFDDKLLGATFEDFNDITTPRYDLLSETWRAAGLKPSWGSPKTHGGFGLDAMCEANWEVNKTGHGAMAPVDWQRGNIGKVIDYCLNDILMTLMFLNAAIRGDAIINPKGGTLKLRDPIILGEVRSSVVSNESVVMSHESVPIGRDPDYQQGRLKDRVEDGEEPASEFDVDAHREGEARKVMGSAEHDYHWDNLVIEIEQLPGEDKWMVAVHTMAGLLIKRKLMLHEWSNEVMNDALLEKDGPAVVKYLQEHEELYKRIGDESGEVK